MKKMMLIVLSCFIVGCGVMQEKIETYSNEPENFIKDPHFADYKEKADVLESSYLKKEITYAEYLEKKKELDEKYNKEVQVRTDKIVPSDVR